MGLFSCVGVLVDLFIVIISVLVRYEVSYKCLGEVLYVFS